MAPTFLGLIRPFQRDGRSDFTAATGEQLIRSAIGQLLGTVGASDTTPGELPWRTEFGSLLYRLRHQRNDTVLQELARVYVVDALKRWEPRVVVTAVEIRREPQDGENVLAIRISYGMLAGNELGNNVVQSGLTQLVIVGSVGS